MNLGKVCEVYVNVSVGGKSTGKGGFVDLFFSAVLSLIVDVELQKMPHTYQAKA